MVLDFVNWNALFPYPRGGKEGTLPFRFENFGTFAGPQFASENYNYDIASQEGFWHTLVPGDFTFKNLDLGAYLFNNAGNYVGFHCDGVSTAMMTLEASYGNIPVFNVFAKQTNVNGDVTVIGDIFATGSISAIGFITHKGDELHTGNKVQIGKFTLGGIIDVEAEINSKKTFDIPHPNKEGWRLRHVCVEGPEDGPIYIRGKLEGNLIKLPDYWENFVDKESISVHLTPFGSQQDLFVEKIEWGKNVYVKNANGGPVNCYYQVWANRLSDEKLHVEYEGKSPSDYPGSNAGFSIAGYDYDRRQK
tara:strand:- start:11316 stop:12230 length:915 start_codon:yes stop_codon:yes gene_type:complete